MNMFFLLLLSIPYLFLNDVFELQADMYSLGVVFFELWHPFGTAMERHVTLTNLKLKGELPLKWVNEFPEQASLLRRLLSPSPSNRPSATELLRHAFPPRMESELLDSEFSTATSLYVIFLLHHRLDLPSSTQC